MIELVPENEIDVCYPVMQQLRTTLSAHEFLQTVTQMYKENYRLAKLTEQNCLKAVMGFRISTNLFMGRNLYIDDLVTADSARSQGHGAALIQWAYAYAHQQSCIAVHLDSGVQRHRAHKFYLNQGMDIICYHFAKYLKPV